MRRLKLTVAYDGTDFHGWQKQQPPGAEPLRTVQAVVERAICMVVRQPIELMGASRTDSGVHAVGQVAAFTTSSEIVPDRMRRAIDSRLPDDVRVIDVTEAHASFDPIHDAVAKGYHYTIAFGGARGARRPLFDRRYVLYSALDLDPARMDEAARHLVGEHDFASFAKVHHGRESTVRTIYECRVRSIDGGTGLEQGPRLRIEVSGNGFLYNMVRIIAGTLTAVGSGRIEPGAIPAILAARDRTAAGTTLAPEGLCLMWVRYE